MNLLVPPLEIRHIRLDTFPIDAMMNVLKPLYLASAFWSVIAEFGLLGLWIQTSYKVKYFVCYITLVKTFKEK